MSSNDYLPGDEVSHAFIINNDAERIPTFRITRDEYGIESTKDIAKEIYEDICKWAETK